MTIPLIPAKTIVSGYSKNGWFGTNYNMNIYKGCCHGCIYCDSRSECYRVEDFDTVRAKENALFVIRCDLESKRKAGIVMTGAMSDPYNPFEKENVLTRGALELLDCFGFGAGIITKSSLVCRDADLLQKIKSHSPAFVNVTVTTADDGLCAKIERYVCPTSTRMATVKSLSAMGIICGILLMPVLPFINDTAGNISQIVRMAADAGAKWVYAGEWGFGVTLRRNQRDYFYKQLDVFFPCISSKYIVEYGERYECISPNSTQLLNMFQSECEKYGLLYRMKDIEALIRCGYQNEQMSFL